MSDLAPGPRSISQIRTRSFSSTSRVPTLPRTRSGLTMTAPSVSRLTIDHAGQRLPGAPAAEGVDEAGDQQVGRAGHVPGHVRAEPHPRVAGHPVALGPGLGL